MFNFGYKHDYILERCVGRTVLDLGCIDAELCSGRRQTGVWLHDKIRNTANRVVGVDVLADQIEVLREIGYDIRFGDLEALENLDLGFIPDVIVAADVIEHLGNPGLFLNGVKRFCGPDTELIITTPNAFYWKRFWWALRRQEPVREDHTCWYSHSTLNQVVRRYGFRINEDVLTAPLKLHVTGSTSAVDASALLLSRRLSNWLVLVASLKLHEIDVA
jgi:2-polyprenyl-3-methyl-5-hydroxy-6-metoxy-1,4-benzoquinol methylase